MLQTIDFPSLRSIEEKNPVICKSKEYIDQILAGTFFNLPFTDITIDTTNFANPNQILIGDSYTTVSNKFFKEMHHYLHQIELSTDLGMLFSDKHTYQYLQNDLIKEMTDFRKAENFLSYSIKLSTRKETYLRSYAKVQNIAAELGGILKVINIICMLVSFYFSKSKFYELLANEIFDVNIDQNGRFRSIKSFTSNFNNHLDKKNNIKFTDDQSLNRIENTIQNQNNDLNLQSFKCNNITVDNEVSKEDREGLKFDSKNENHVNNKNNEKKNKKLSSVTEVNKSLKGISKNFEEKKKKENNISNNLIGDKFLPKTENNLQINKKLKTASYKKSIDSNRNFELFLNKENFILNSDVDENVKNNAIKKIKEISTNTNIDATNTSKKRKEEIKKKLEKKLIKTKKSNRETENNNKNKYSPLSAPKNNLSFNEDRDETPSYLENSDLNLISKNTNNNSFNEKQDFSILNKLKIKGKKRDESTDLIHIDQNGNLITCIYKENSDIKNNSKYFFDIGKFDSFSKKEKINEKYNIINNSDITNIKTIDVSKKFINEDKECQKIENDTYFNNSFKKIDKSKNKTTDDDCISNAEIKKEENISIIKITKEEDLRTENNNSNINLGNKDNITDKGLISPEIRFKNNKYPKVIIDKDSDYNQKINDSHNLSNEEMEDNKNIFFKKNKTKIKSKTDEVNPVCIDYKYHIDSEKDLYLEKRDKNNCEIFIEKDHIEKKRENSDLIDSSEISQNYFVKNSLDFKENINQIIIREKNLNLSNKMQSSIKDVIEENSIIINDYSQNYNFNCNNDSSIGIFKDKIFPSSRKLFMLNPDEQSIMTRKTKYQNKDKLQINQINIQSNILMNSSNDIFMKRKSFINNKTTNNIDNENSKLHFNKNKDRILPSKPRSNLIRRIKYKTNLPFLDSICYSCCRIFKKRSKNFMIIDRVRIKIDDILDIVKFIKEIIDFERVKRIIFDNDQFTLFEHPYYLPINLDSDLTTYQRIVLGFDDNLNNNKNNKVLDKKNFHLDLSQNLLFKTKMDYYSGSGIKKSDLVKAVDRVMDVSHMNEFSKRLLKFSNQEVINFAK